MKSAWRVLSAALVAGAVSSPIMRLSLLALLLALAGCRSERTVKGAWYELKVPASWVDFPTKTEAEKASVEAAWRAPPGAPKVNAILARPVRFDGDARAYAQTQGPGLALIGLKAGGGWEGSLGDLPAFRQEATTRDGALVRYWYFKRGALVGALQCGGIDPSNAEAAVTCDEIAASFRLTGDPPAPKELPMAEPKTLEVNGYRMRVPSNWNPFNRAAVPVATWVVRSDAMVGSGFPSALLTVTPWTGDLQGFDAEGDRQNAGTGIRKLGTRTGALFGGPATVVEDLYPRQMGGHLAVQYEAVKAGQAYVLTCAGDPNFADPVRQACALIAGSLEELPRP
jgi:hypothetical protein